MKNHLLSQSLNLGSQTIQGPLDSSVDSLGKIITKGLAFIMPMAGIVLLFVLISGGYDYMMSQGNADKIKSAQAKITSGIIGFILLIASFFITRLIALIFGLGGGIF
jgi:TRAP-type C4-dicarboxylate transport system permease small subunit